MIIKELRELLAEVCPDAALLDNQSYDKSIIGYSDDDRAIPYIDSSTDGHAPIILHRIEV